MLVRVFHCDSEHLNNPFTERDCRITRDLDNKEWDEFLVIWRKHRIELYEDYVSRLSLDVQTLTC